MSKRFCRAMVWDGVLYPLAALPGPNCEKVSPPLMFQKMDLNFQESRAFWEHAEGSHAICCGCNWKPDHTEPDGEFSTKQGLDLEDRGSTLWDFHMEPSNQTNLRNFRCQHTVILVSAGALHINQPCILCILAHAESKQILPSMKDIISRIYSLV